MLNKIVVLSLILIITVNSSYIPFALQKALDTKDTKVIDAVYNVGFEYLKTAKEALISGDCSYDDGKTDKCSVFASNTVGLKIEYFGSYLPNIFRKSNGTYYIPYTSIQQVITDVSYIPPRVKYTYILKISNVKTVKFVVLNKWTVFVNSSLTYSQDNYGKYNNGILKQMKTLLQTTMNKRIALIESNKSLKDQIDINNKLKDIRNRIRVLREGRNELKARFLDSLFSYEAKKSGTNHIERIFKKCKKEQSIITNLYETYKTFYKEFSDDRIYEFLYKEQSNMCKFQYAMDDINIVLPNLAPLTEELTYDVVENYKVSGMNSFYEDKEFYINNTD